MGADMNSLEFGILSPEYRRNTEEKIEFRGAPKTGGYFAKFVKC